MDLFSNHIHTNILPVDGDVYYYGKILNSEETTYYFERLLTTIAWKHDEAIVFGKKLTTPRKVAWYGDIDFSYTYSQVTKQALPWTPELMKLKQLVQNTTGASFNSCLMNLYHSGEEGVGWHSDGEKMLGPVIASISLGAERKFSFKHKQTKQPVSILLENGSLLVMKGETQRHWLHCLPKSKNVTRPRINLTFRTIIHPL